MRTHPVKSLLLSTALLLASPSLAEDTPQAAKPIPTFKLEGNELKLPTAITFKASEDTLKSESTEALEHARQYLDAKTYITLLRIEGHVAEGTPNAQALSEKRALAVARWLVSKGVDCKRLLPVGFGDTKPVADNATPEGKAQNTRVALMNAALRGRPIGGMPVDGDGKVAGDPCATK